MAHGPASAVGGAHYIGAVEPSNTIKLIAFFVDARSFTRGPRQG